MSTTKNPFLALARKFKEWRKQRIVRELRKAENAYGHRLLDKLMAMDEIDMPEEERYLRIIDICAKYKISLVIPN